MNITGILLGLFTILVIGAGFVWVIKLEYYVGARAAKAVSALGAAVILASLFMPGFASAAIVGILGGTLVWGGMELPLQAKRVKQGLFPANPNRQEET